MKLSPEKEVFVCVKICIYFYYPTLNLLVINGIDFFSPSRVCLPMMVIAVECSTCSYLYPQAFKLTFLPVSTLGRKVGTWLSAKVDPPHCRKGGS